MEARFFAPGTIAPVTSEEPFPTDPALEVGRSGALHDPPLEPRDEAVFLLTAAAEIEHALMVQYLYAAYSVHVAGPNGDELQRVRRLLVQIAREEMGHLATVQNLLHLVGGPLNLGRDRAPYGSEIYPFRFRLEPVTRGSLAKYVTAESPRELPGEMSPEDRALVVKLRDDAAAANDGNPVNHVGPIFARLAELFGDTPDSLADADFRTGTGARQADRDDWGYAPLSPADGSPLLIGSFTGTDVSALRQAARTAVQEIGDQGEGFDLPPAGTSPTPTESHFERFFDVYKRVSRLFDEGDPVTWPVATDPNTTPGTPTNRGRSPADRLGAAAEELAAGGRITEPRARAWAQLFNLRYRMLLGQLAHFLRLDGELYRTASGPQQGDRTARGLLLLGTFDEMRHLEKIAGKLVQLPKDAGGTVHAGPPFELPYTLQLPDGEPARWRMHLDASRASTRLVTSRLAPEADPFLTDLVGRDIRAQEVLAALAAGAEIPATGLPTGFAKAVTILQEAVRGFRVGGRHGNFWAGRTRDQFVTTPVPPIDVPPVALDGTGAVVPDPAEAPLIERLTATDARARMPRFRPPVPVARIGYLQQWIRDGAPDDDPPGRVGVTVEPDPADETTAPAEVLSFAADIVGLFRDSDRDSMSFAFDLHRFEDVRDHADEILARVADGSMPCDGPWPAGRVELFRRWIDDGRLP
ncbi:ferritin-like domain-containing protein [Blastococcus deserti]|uniref:Ferritin-like domain-containing protein n=1 Tax=Blastococcus deserti TaxID=2259033 RepID=A0ABW4XAL9_9ACTN